eukprot:TRINITY_DN21847_c0_g1_i1.p1 TRINITY_DN21847_c0_g1~~TRINITY_DN21847_c0_g1_i1.p1  ORF type:complete len:398 (+),score=164.83 TRINITY_DN21847_c0_g1_i1:89-1282(+)
MQAVARAAARPRVAAVCRRGYAEPAPAEAPAAPARVPILERLRRREERLKARRGGVLDEAMQGLRGFGETLEAHGQQLVRQNTGTLQVNIGLLCNQTCHHCHVEAGPARVVENMDRNTVDALLRLIDASGDTVHTVDITGGAPELNKNFRHLVKEARRRGLKVIDRCNLTVLHEPGQEDTAEFLAEQACEVVASMPCYSPDNVDAQRGDGVFDKSISSLQRLNEVGFAKEGTGLDLHLVYNPLGAFLPPPQQQLEAVYKEKLRETFGIEFSSLFCITNLPVKRFADDLAKEGKLADYMKLLVDSYNPSTVENLMCLNHISVRWDGTVYDCDFNQQLAMPISVLGAETPVAEPSCGGSLTIWDLKTLNDLRGARIGIGAHCYGCTAGSGSSCGGTLEA